MTYHACYLSGISIDEEADQQTVLVNERSGTRRFPIAIGQMEALAIDRAVKGQIFPRPLTHDLLLVTLDAMLCELSEIRITDLRGGTFFAELAILRLPRPSPKPPAETQIFSALCAALLPIAC